MVTRAQLICVGVSAAEIKSRVGTGTLLREHRGIYRVGHRAPSVEARYLAAVLACGAGALLGGRAGGYLFSLLKGTAPPPGVITPTERRVKGVTTKRSRCIDPRDATIWRGIPVTTVARTLVDLAAVLSTDHLARACHEAGVRYGTTPARIEGVLERRPTSRGAATLHRVIRGEIQVTLSKLEAVFVMRLREAGLPLPETNRPAGGRRVDCRWPERCLTIELDSYRYHHSRHAWEQDRRREREAFARDDEFRRYTHGDVFEDPEAMLAELRSLLDPKGPVQRSSENHRAGR